MNGSFSAPSAGWTSHRPSLAVWLWVVFAHALLALSWQLATQPKTIQRQDTVVWLQWPQKATPRPSPPTAAAHPTRPTAPFKPNPIRPQGPPSPGFAPTQPPLATQPSTALSATLAASSPSAPVLLPAVRENTELLLHTEATRRAVQQAARERGTSSQARASLGQEDGATPADRLGQAVKQAGKGDCLKGEFAGAGMGLLSLPFLLAAELMEKCSR
jgi:hypothetical protein